MSRELNGGGRERASQVPDLHFRNCNLGPKSAFFLPKTALEPAENGQMKGNSGYSTRAARLPRATALYGPLTPQYVRKPPPKGPQKHQNLCTLAADSPKPKLALNIGTQLVGEGTSSRRLERQMRYTLESG